MGGITNEKNIHLGRKFRIFWVSEFSKNVVFPSPWTNSESLEIENIETATGPLREMIIEGRTCMKRAKSSVSSSFIYAIRHICIEKGLLVMKRDKFNNIDLLYKIGSERSLNLRNFWKNWDPCWVFKIPKLKLGLFSLPSPSLEICPNILCFLLMPDQSSYLRK